ncbi:hypothetical protein HMN09_00318600 [Mycena chlorophos]|uniref:Uncharacterized protein n=1 Tax=Mycena chlorophos TaxID=658473 RepID=A0A8H6WHR2_MYCCL|nr:hypothetical protein HMN09_00318600 [Mycena chlorophos]
MDATRRYMRLCVSPLLKLHHRLKPTAIPLFTSGPIYPPNVRGNSLFEPRLLFDRGPILFQLQQLRARMPHPRAGRISVVISLLFVARVLTQLSRYCSAQSTVSCLFDSLFIASDRGLVSPPKSPPKLPIAVRNIQDAGFWDGVPVRS